jgi:hypothetical protein
MASVGRIKMEATKEAREFFKEKNVAVHKMVQRRRPGTTPEQVQSAAQKVYESIMSGEKIKDISLAYRVWSEATNMPPGQPQGASQKIRGLQGQLAERTDELARQTRKLQDEQDKSEKLELFLWRGVWVAFFTTGGCMTAVIILLLVLWRVTWNYP